MRISNFLSSKLIVSCTNLEHMSVVRDCAEFTNLSILVPKVVQLEMKTIVNIGNSCWMVLRLYPCYINDFNSHLEYFVLSKLSKKQYNSSEPPLELLFLERNKLVQLLAEKLSNSYILHILVQHSYFQDSYNSQ